MDHGHAKRYACRLARQLAGDFFPGPVLMPHGMLHAMEPVLAVALGPARHGSEAFAAALERTLRGRPDGPLLLALWASCAAGEIPHRDLREMVRLLPDRLREQPASRGELLGFLHPRVSVVARCLLAVAQRQGAAALAPAERLGLGIAVTSMLARLPAELAAGRIGFPAADLERAGLELAELRQGLRSPAVDAFLVQEAAWARELLDEGLDLRAHVGSRLRRGVRAVVVRSRRLLDQVEDPRRDIFRRPPRLTESQRWACAIRALIGLQRRRA
nr:squalene/phytoene synthase family protein [Planctomycetota bacterium]